MDGDLIIRNPAEIRKKLQEWRRWGKFCDATLSVNGRGTRVHAVVVASMNRFLEQKFTDSEMSPKVVTCSTVNINAFRAIVEYCYHGSLRIHNKNAMEILRVSNALKITSITENCAMVLKNRLSFNNCLSTWEMAKTCDYEALNIHIIRFIKEHIDKVSHSDHYLSLKYSELKTVLSSNVKSKSKKKSIYRAIKRWIEYDASRKNHMDDLLDCAKIERLSTDKNEYEDYLANNMNQENWLKMWKMADNSEHEALKSLIIPFVKRNIDQIDKSDDYLSLEYPEVKLLFSSEKEANSKAELVHYDALKRWIGHNSDRKKHLNELLGYVKLTCLSKDTLLSEALKICGSSSECFAKFLRASTSKGRIEDSSGPSSSGNTLMVFQGSASKRLVSSFEIFHLKLNKWVEIQKSENMIFCDNTAAVAIIGEKLLLTGGMYSRSAYYYDLKNDELESLTSMPYVKYSPSAVTYGNHVYLFGRNTTQNYSSVEKWSSTTRTWQEVSRMSSERTSMGAAVLDNEIFLVGGFFRDHGYFSLVEAYNPTTNTWRKCQDMNYERQNPGVASVNGFLYVAGGYNNDDDYDMRCIKTAEKYDKTINRWTMIQSLDIGRYTAAAGVLNGQFVITGGIKRSGDEMNSVQAYDEKNDRWLTLHALNRKRSYHRSIQMPWSLAEPLLSKVVWC